MSNSKPLKCGYSREICVEDVPLKYLCTHCRKILRNPHQTNCGHRFCSPCLLDHIMKMRNPKCPEDSTSLNPDECFLDNFAKRELNQLMIVCENHLKGCQWRGKLGGYDNHCTECLFATTFCLLCEVKIVQKDLEDHRNNECSQRQRKCEFCTNYVSTKHYNDHLTKECLKIVIDCPHNCGLARPREEIDRHLKNGECSVSLKLCPYGCKKEVPGNQLDSHLKNVAVHLCELTSRVERLEDAPSQILPCSGKVVSDSAPKPSSNTTFDGPPLSGDVDKDTTSGDLQGGKKNSAYETSPTLALSTVVEDKVRNAQKRIDDVERELMERIRAVEKSSRDFVPRAKFDMLQRKCEQLESRQIQLELEKKRQDDVLRQLNTVMPDFDLRISILESTNYEGKLVWKISDFRRRYEEAASGKTHSLYSQPFFTSRYGYKMCLRLYPHGDGMGKSKCLSLFFVIMQGEYDDILSWPFERKISFTLLNPSGRAGITDSFIPDPKSSSFQKPKGVMNIASGCPLFASLDRVWNEGFVKNDCLYIKACVSVL